MTPPEPEPSEPEPLVHKVQNDFEPSNTNEPAVSDGQGSVPMRQFKKSSKLDNVLYDVRGPVVDEAARMESQGMRILKLNIGNPARLRGLQRFEGLVQRAQGHHAVLSNQGPSQC